MAEYQFETAWRRSDPKHATDAMKLWSAHGLAMRGAADKRIEQLCAMAYHEGELVGVTTVEFTEYPLFRSRFAFYRAFVDREHRQHELAILLTRHTLTVMENWSLENPAEKLQGVAAIIEGKALAAKAHNPVWSEYYGNLNLAGYTQAGHQVRVAWFRHARVD